MNRNELKDHLLESTNELLVLLEGIPEEGFNEKPSTDRWSAGDVAEHLVILEDYSLRIITGSSQSVKRKPMEKERLLRKTFASPQKLRAGEPVQASGTIKDKQVVLQKLKAQNKRIMDLLLEMKLGEECVDFKHPLFGYLTRAEWVLYLIYHRRRHAQQIQDLKLNAEK